MNDGKKVAGGLVIACGNSTELLEFAQESSVANVERRGFNAITSLAPCLFGLAWLLSLGKPGKPYIASSMDCLMNSCDSSLT